MLRMTLENIWRFVRKPHVIVILSTLVFGTIFIKITPPLWGLDEPSHVGRVLHIIKGQFASNGDQNNPANFVPDNLSELTRYRIDDILDVVRVDNVISRKDVTDPSVYERITSRPLDKSEHFSTYIAGNYSPVAYPGPILGAGIAQVLNLTMGQTLTLMRFMSLFSYIALAAFAVWIVRNYKVKWLFLVAAMIPTAIFQSSVVTADTMVLGISLLFLALVYRIALGEGVQKKLLVALAVVTVLTPLIKANHIVLMLLLLALPAARFGSKKASIIYKTGVIVGGMCLTFAWSQLTQLPASATYSQRADQVTVVPAEQISRTLHNPLIFGKAVVKSLVIFGDAYYQGMLFTVSGNAVGTPILLTASLSGAILLAAFMAKDELRRIKKLIVWGGLVAVAFAALVFGALYASFSPVGWPIVDGVQGRYFLPLIVPISMLIAILIPVEVRAKPRNLKIMLVAMAVLSLLTSVAYVYIAYY